MTPLNFLKLDYVMLFSSRSAVQPEHTLLHYFPIITVKLRRNSIVKSCK